MISSEPYPAANVTAKPVCENHRLCLSNDYDYLLVMWELPLFNSFLLCPVEQAWLNYSYLELEVEMESFQVTYPNITVTDTSFEVTPVMPGTTYNVTISFVNEVGESLDNTVGMCTIDPVVVMIEIDSTRDQPGTLSVLDSRDNNYTMESAL